jgi:hypothetical protein
MSYLVLRRLGGGGFSEVFEIEDLESALPERLAVWTSGRRSPGLLLTGLAVVLGWLWPAGPAGAFQTRKALDPPASQQARPETSRLEKPAAAAAPEFADPLLAWRREVDVIADLLIDGRCKEARDQADQLLARKGLPEEIAARARELRDKADAKLAKLAGPKVEVQGAVKKDPEPPKPQRSSFQVQVGLAGTGFRKGARGQFQIAEERLIFVPRDKGQRGWSIPWPELEKAGKADGLWDVAYPIVILQRGGVKHYVVRIDERGRYLPGEPILAAIREKGSSATRESERNR